MNPKRKKSARPDSWQRVRHFEYVVPATLEETMHSITLYRDDLMDMWLQRLSVLVDQADADLCRITGSREGLTFFEGYMKALPDGTTLVSGTATARIVDLTNNETTPQQDALVLRYGGVLLIIISLITVFFLVVLPEHWLLLTTAICGVSAFHIIYWLIFIPTSIDLAFGWIYALRQRDDLLIALQKRLGIESEMIK